MKLNSVFATAASTLAVTFTAVGFSSQALGFTFRGESQGRWGIPNPGGNTNPTFTGVGENTFTWGQKIPDDPRFGTDPNRLIFSGISFSTDSDSVFRIGDLEYFNGTVPQGTNVDSVPLDISLSLQSPNLVEAFNFNFLLINTENKETGTPEENADTVMVMNNFGNRSFRDDQGVEYRLDLLGFSQDDGSTTVSEFRVFEGAQTTAGVYARITQVTPPTKKIPEPASIVGTSVLGIYFLSRKKKFLRAKD